MTREGHKKQAATSTPTITENFETEVPGMLTMMDSDSLTFAFGILGLVVPEQKKDNLKLLLKYILRQFNSEDEEGSDYGGCSWYTKLHNHLKGVHQKVKCKIGKK